MMQQLISDRLLKFSDFDVNEKFLQLKQISANFNYNQIYPILNFPIRILEENENLAELMFLLDAFRIPLQNPSFKGYGCISLMN